MWVCVLGLGSRLHSPILAVVLDCMCLCARFARTPPVLARSCGVGLSGPVLAFHPANPCWGVGVCVFVCALRLYTAIPGSAVPCGCACWGSGLGCTPPFLAGMLGCLCLCARFARTPPVLARVCGLGVLVRALAFQPTNPGWGVWVCLLVCALRLYPAIAGSAVRCGCACSGLRYGCTPPFLAGGVGVCVFVCAVRQYPAYPGWGLWPLRLGSGFGSHPTYPRWGVGLCLFLCVLCPHPANHGAVLVCPFPFWLSPRQSWLGYQGVCVCVRA